MNLYVVAGLILGAIASGLLIFGGRLDSRRDAKADSAELLRKMDDVRGEIKEAQAHPSTREAASQLDIIDQEFQAWAEDFVKNKARTQIEVDEIETDAKQQALAASLAAKKGALQERQYSSNTARPVLAAALVALRKAIAAYNAQSGSHFTVELPELPLDLYDEAAKQYNGAVGFQGKAAWSVKLSIPSSPVNQYQSGEYNFPGLSIILDPLDTQETADVSVLGYGAGPLKMSVSLSSTKLPKLKGIGANVPLTDYNTVLNRAMQRLLEAQVFVLK